MCNQAVKQEYRVLCIQFPNKFYQPIKKDSLMEDDIHESDGRMAENTVCFDGRNKQWTFETNLMIGEMKRKKEMQVQMLIKA